MTFIFHELYILMRRACGQVVYEKRIGIYNFNKVGKEMDKALAPHSSTLAWKIPWTEESSRLQSMRFSSKDTGVGCHFLLQGIFPTQGLNLGLLHCRQILYRLSYKGSRA